MDLDLRLVSKDIRPTAPETRERRQLYANLDIVHDSIKELMLQLTGAMYKVYLENNQHIPFSPGSPTGSRRKRLPGGKWFRSSTL